MEEFYVVRARGDDVLLRLLRMLREGRIDMKPLKRMDDAELYRTVSIWFDPTSTASVFSWESTYRLRFCPGNGCGFDHHFGWYSFFCQVVKNGATRLGLARTNEKKCPLV